MMPIEINLSGNDWKALPLMPREWEWRQAGSQADSLMPALWIPATVPGTVQDDARDAGLTPDFTVDFNSRACEWTSERDWVYLREFETPEVPQDGVVRLRFEGVDHECHVYLNGHHLGDHAGMYDAFEYDITGILAAEGQNKLVVILEHAPREVGQIGRTSEVRIWKARFAYNWDWCTRLVPIGIFDSVSLLVTGPVYIRDVQVTTSLADDFSAADVGISVDLETKTTTPVRVCTAVSWEGSGPHFAAKESVLASGERTGYSRSVRIADPRLWWPNGYGDQPLYEAVVEVCDEAGNILDAAEVTFGIRRVRALQNDDAPEGALPYVLEVNGKRVYMKGWNWAPISQLYGREMHDRYRRWVTLAADANCNLLRIWGGGLLEKETFYELCDRLGIMVWQEFIHSSSGIDNQPAKDPEYLAYIRGQAEKMIPRRRNHPSLILWCGGNELMHDDWAPLDDTHPALAELRDCVRRLDPDRLWLPTSASGPCANAALDKVGQMHDVHGPWQYQGPQEQYALYNGIDPLLHAEFGVEGAANIEAMRKAASSEDLLWPPDDTNPLWMHKGAWWVQRPMMTRVFGEINDLEAYVKASQLLQAEGLRYCLEASRRRKWRTAGAAPWQLNESWPNLSCTNIIDYFGQPRPAYWWARKALEPFHVSAKYDKLFWSEAEGFEAEVWTNNSLADAEGVMVTWQLLDITGHEIRSGQWDLIAPGAAATCAGKIEAPLPQVTGSLLILRVGAVAADGRSSRNDYLFSTATEPVFAPVLTAPRTTVSTQRDGKSLTLRNTGDAFALAVKLDAEDDSWMEFSDNYLLLAPGEEVEVTCKPAETPVRVSGINVE